MYEMTYITVQDLNAFELGMDKLSIQHTARLKKRLYDIETLMKFISF